MKYLFSSVTFFAMATLAILPSGAYPGPTKIVTYNAANMKMTGKTVKGYCWFASLASRRSDAFRCTSGHRIMDPCFSISAKIVNCSDNIATNTGTVIDLTRPLPKKNAPRGGAWPLGFELAGGSGIMCNANSTGIALTDFGNYEYYCNGNLVCTVPNASAKMPEVYLVTCATSSAHSRSVKGVRTLFVMTIWQ
jgi:hypothetical protein